MTTNERLPVSARGNCAGQSRAPTTVAAPVPASSDDQLYRFQNTQHTATCSP